MMKVKYFNRFAALMTGMFLAGMAHSYGQNISDTPAGNHLPLGGKTLYEHGYNSAGKDTPRETLDSVMVTSVMNYFVMPDKNYNAGYYAQTGYAATNLTSSNFVWTVPSASGTFVPQTPNSTATSPWIKVTWTATGPATMKVKEEPQGLAGSCDSEETEIGVVVIPKPTIGFNQTGSPPAFAASDCYSETDVANAAYDFPITVTTSSSQVLIDYSIKKTDLAGVVTTTTVTDAPVTSGTLHLTFGDYGDYEVTITKITDRIARKCDVVGDILTGSGVADVFTYSVIPQPKTGPVFHIPNNF